MREFQWGLPCALGHAAAQGPGEGGAVGRGGRLRLRRASFHFVSIVELRDGEMWRDTRYYAEPFEDPEWRARWVERMEP
jgi:hypothetical protein